MASGLGHRRSSSGFIATFSSSGACLQDWLTVLKDIETFCEDFKPCGFITEDIAVLLSSNNNMVYDFKMTVFPGHRAMYRFRPSANDMEVAALAGNFTTER